MNTTVADFPIVAHLCVANGAEAMAFYKRAFDAEIVNTMQADDGTRVLHANLNVFGQPIMLHDEFPEMEPDVLAPTTRGGASLALTVSLSKPADVDRAIDKAAAAGAVITMPADNQFWGARYGRVRDPFGHIWAFNAPLPTEDQASKETS